MDARNESDGAREAGLTERETQVILLIVEGLTDQDIAQQLGVSERTVHAHVGNCLRKTGTASRTALAVFALRKGVAPLHPSCGEGTV